jgi:hypothetical protein
MRISTARCAKRGSIFIVLLIAVHLLLQKLLHRVQSEELIVELLNDANVAGIAIIKVTLADKKRSTAKLTLCTWAEHQHAPEARAALEGSKVVSEKRCGRFTEELYSVPAEAPGDYVFYAAAVSSGAAMVHTKTSLGTAATVRFSVNVKAADKDCVKLSADLPRMAVVTATFGGYDPLRGVHVADCSGLVDYYTFTDTPGYAHNREVITEPYHLHDDVAILHPSGKNSLADVSRLSPSRISMMASKYYKVSALPSFTLYCNGAQCAEFVYFAVMSCAMTSNYELTRASQHAITVEVCQV